MLNLENQAPFSLRRGTIPVLVSIPHNGSRIPADIYKSMTEDGRSSRDTDWYLDRLYDIPELQEASCLIASFSRYVVDVNRPPDDRSLYPGQSTTGLIPVNCFDGAPIYIREEPDREEIEQRVTMIWKPYHTALTNELERIRSEHGRVCLLEAHSIKSQVPRLFEGTLPDFNIGTNHDQSCDRSLTASVLQALGQQDDYRYVANERFVGGYITRHYGRPEQNTHALQIELSQATYMDESTLTWAPRLATQVRPTIQQVVKSIIDWIRQR